MLLNSNFQWISVQFSSVAQSCLTLCDPMNCSTPGLPVHHQLPDFTQTHVIESVMPFNHLILCRPLLFLPSIFPSIRVFSNEAAFPIRWQSNGVVSMSWLLWKVLLWTFSSLQFRRSVVSNSLRPQGLQQARLPCLSLSPGVCSNSSPSSRWCHSTISSSVVPFSSRLRSFPASGSLPMSQFFASGGQSIGASASVSFADQHELEIRD